MNAILIKTISGLMPADPPSEDWYKRVKIGSAVSVETKVIRNYCFLKKYFALLNIGFDNWTPGEINSDYGVPEKNFKRFRKDVAIQCGFYEMVIRLDGTAKPEALSISFANMEEPEFQDLYSKTIDLFLKKIYGKDVTAEELDETVNRYLSFV